MQYLLPSSHHHAGDLVTEHRWKLEGNLALLYLDVCVAHAASSDLNEYVVVANRRHVKLFDDQRCVELV